MGIDKIGPRAPSGPLPAINGRPAFEGPHPGGSDADASGQPVEDARATIGGGRQSEISAPAELPAGFDPLPDGPGSEFQGPAGVLLPDGRPLGGAEGIRARGGSISGDDLARLHILVSAGEGSRIVSPADLGLVAISA